MEESLLSHKLARTFPLSKKPAVAVFHRLSRERHAQGAYRKYVVVEPKPSRYALRAVERTKGGWTISFAQSRPFTGDYHVAESAADLFTRSALSPIHLDDAIRDFMSTL